MGWGIAGSGVDVWIQLEVSNGGGGSLGAMEVGEFGVRVPGRGVAVPGFTQILGDLESEWDTRTTENKWFWVFGKGGKCRGPTLFPAAAQDTSHCVPLRRSPVAQTWGRPWRHLCWSRHVEASRTQAGWSAGILAERWGEGKTSRSSGPCLA